MNSRIVDFAVALFVVTMIILSICVPNPVGCMSVAGLLGGDVLVGASVVEDPSENIDPPDFNASRAADNRIIRVAIVRAVANPSERVYVRADRSEYRRLRRTIEPLSRDADQEYPGVLVTYGNRTVFIWITREQ